jgi:aminopeptidase N
MKFSNLLVLISILLALLTGCTSNTAAPTVTPTKVPPTTVVVTEPSPTESAEFEPGASGMGDSLYPDFGNGGYDVLHYTLDIIVNDVSTSRLEGMTSLDAKATQNLSSFNLDFIGFEITNITVNGESAEFERAGQELTITPSTPLSANESFTAEIQYEGSPGEINSEAISFQTGWITFEGGSFVLGEPDGAATFFPVNDHPLDKAPYTMRVTVPEPFKVAANGVLTETIDQEDGNTFVFEMHDPMASYLVTINVAEFDMETSESENGVPIRNYYPAGRLEDGSRTFARQGEMIDYFSSLFGPYPFEVYGAVVIDTEFGAALETQTLSIFSRNVIDADQPEGSQQVIAHELAHQWFGDSVSLADWRDIWLNESFATYSQALWMEHTEGREALDEWIRRVYAAVQANRNSVTPPGEPSAANLFNGGVYFWGALCLHALRLEVGEDVFFQILQTYHEQYQDGNATTADFIAVAEEVSGKELSAFFDSWLYSEDLAPIPQLGLEAS